MPDAPRQPTSRQLAMLEHRRVNWNEGADWNEGANGNEGADTAAQLLTYAAFLEHCHALRDDRAATSATRPELVEDDATAAELNALVNGSRDVAARVAEVHRILDATDLLAVLADLEDRYQPVLSEAHFYERFLARYSRHDRRSQGVYYTPGPLARFMIRGLRSLLAETWFAAESDGQRGDPARVPALRVIDPACGSGTFLLACSRRTGGQDALPSKWSEQLVGLDVQPVACRVARWLLARQQRQEAHSLGSLPAPWHWSIRCANALEQQHLDELFEHRDHGGTRPLPVILGNPPYGIFGRRNRLPWIRELLADYKVGLHERKLNLDDDFIKFIRWAQHHVDAAGAGVVALVTSNTYLSGLTHRRMRESLRRSFDRIYVLDLHGDRKRDARLAAAGADENVFGIQQGVAVSVFLKTGSAAGPAPVLHGSLRGSRREKLEQLDRADIRDLCRREIADRGSVSFFVPRGAALPATYDDFPGLDEIFEHFVSGIQTKADAMWTDRRRGRLAARVRSHLKQRPTGKEAAIVFDPHRLRPYQVAPFDFRWIYYEPRLLGRARWSVARHLLRPNLALVFMRQSTNQGAYDHFLASTQLVSDRVFYSGHGAPFFAPLWCDEASGRESNLQPAFLDRLSRLWPFRLDVSAHGRMPRAFGARDVFDYAYAVFHAPRYRSDYRDRLAVGFPRLPLTGDSDLIRRLCAIGRRLVALHTTVIEPSFPEPEPRWRGERNWQIAPGRPRFATRPGAGRRPATDIPLGRIDINPQASLENITKSDWDFHVGGYPVIARWLRSRRAATLRAADRDYLRHLVGVARETRQLAAELQSLLSPWPW